MNQLIERISRQEFWNALRKKLIEARSSDEATQWLDNTPFDEANLWERTGCDLDVTFQKSYSVTHENWFQKLLKRDVLDAVGLPWPVTLVDLNEAARSQLAGCRASEIDSCKERFIVHVSLLRGCP